MLLAGPEPFIIHFEAFASWDASVRARALTYNAVHHRRHLLPVHTVLVVLRPEADHPSLTGEYRVVTPVTGRVHLLEYQVLRAWELELDTVLRGSLATLPLAPLADAARSQLPEVLRQMEMRLAAEASPEERKDLWTDTFVLMGLRYPKESVAQWFRGIPAMRESETYQAILEEGRQEGWQAGRGQGQNEGLVLGARRSLLLVGTPRFGEPDAATRQRIEAETDLAQLETWLSHTGSAESWSDLPGLQP